MGTIWGRPVSALTGATGTKVTFGLPPATNISKTSGVMDRRGGGRTIWPLLARTVLQRVRACFRRRHQGGPAFFPHFWVPDSILTHLGASPPTRNKSEHPGLDTALHRPPSDTHTHRQTWWWHTQVEAKQPPTEKTCRSACKPDRYQINKYVVRLHKHIHTGEVITQEREHFFLCGFVWKCAIFSERFVIWKMSHWKLFEETYSVPLLLPNDVFCQLYPFIFQSVAASFTSGT